MAHNRIHFVHPLTGQLRTAPVGFSWTVLFFGGWPMVFRGDWKQLLITLLLTPVTLGIYWIYLWFNYNKMYIKKLVSDGFKAKGVDKGSISDVSTQIGLVIPELTTNTPSSHSEL